MTVTTDRKQDILNAARDLIVNEGLTSFTIRKVADAAGISTGLVLYHFETKERLIEEAWRATVHGLGERIEAASPAQEGRDWMDATFRIRFKERDEVRFPSLVWLEYWIHLVRTPELQSDRAETYSMWREHNLGRIERALRDGDLRSDLDPSLVVDMFHTLVCGLLVKTAIDSEVITSDRAYELGRFFLSLISTPQISTPQDEGA
jgi:AcrR family transcriptional regulator